MLGKSVIGRHVRAHQRISIDAREDGAPDSGISRRRQPREFRPRAMQSFVDAPCCTTKSALADRAVAAEAREFSYTARARGMAFGLWGVVVRGVPLTHELAQPPLDHPAIGRWCAEEQRSRRRRLEVVQHALDDLQHEPTKDLSKVALERGRVVVADALREGLQRRAWKGPHDNAPNWAHLSGSAINAYGHLRHALARFDSRPGGSGPYVCVGDDDGPGCGLVFMRQRTPRRPRCDVCRRRPISWPAGVVGAVWLDSYDAACRTLTLARRCADCAGLLVWRSDAKGRPPMYCSSCATPAASTSRSRRAV